MYRATQTDNKSAAQKAAQQLIELEDFRSMKPFVPDIPT